MTARWVGLSENERAAFHAVTAFLQGRLEDRATIDWALKLSPNDAVQRLALLEQIDSLQGRKIGEPWRTAWRLIEESWNQPQVDPHASVEAYHIRDRLTQGERTGSLVTAIVQLVAPRLEIKPFSNLDLSFRKPPKRPKNVEDLFSVGLTSGEIVDPDELGLGNLTDRAFLVSLAHALDAAVASGLDIARFMGWHQSSQTWRMGMLYRVHYAPVAERNADEHEPDEFHRGIAPSVKLLHAVVQRLANVDISEAATCVRCCKLANTPIQARLWAALSLDRRVTPANEAADWLLALDQERFWDLHGYPEIAELRAKRFGEFEPQKQAAITNRIRKRPPRNHWPREADADHVERGRFYWVVQELRRIELAGATLPKRDKAWLDARIHEFPDLKRMARLDYSFLTSPKAQWVEPNPDDRYDFLSGEERLKALESALSSTRGGWDDNSSGRAFDWIKQPGNFIKLLADLESVPDGGAAYSKVWEKIGWTHSPEVRTEENAAHRDLPMESTRVLTLLAKLPPSTLSPAIDGVTHWLVYWAKHILISKIPQPNTNKSSYRYGLPVSSRQGRYSGHHPWSLGSGNPCRSDG